MNRSEPLYISIMHILKERIIEGDYPVGSLMPTEHQLEEEFEVSKITIRKAIELLDQEGYVVKKSGRGTTVISNSVFNRVSKTANFPQLMQRVGKRMQKETIEITYLSLTPDHEFFQYFRNSCIKITRVFYLGLEPYAYFTHYLPGNLHISETKDDNKFSIYMNLFKNNYLISQMRDEYYVNEPTEEIQEKLRMGNQPLLGKKRTTYSTDGKVIEITYSNYNTNMQHYCVEYNIE